MSEEISVCLQRWKDDDFAKVSILIGLNSASWAWVCLPEILTMKHTSKKQTRELCLMNGQIAEGGHAVVGRVKSEG